MICVFRRTMHVMDLHNHPGRLVPRGRCGSALIAWNEVMVVGEMVVWRLYRTGKEVTKKIAGESVRLAFCSGNGKLDA